MEFSVTGWGENSPFWEKQLSFTFIGMDYNFIAFGVIWIILNILVENA
jgi:hypothetical protein